jgi:uncharacterized OsmC-like protein/pimeloyl-ACP methyl ester carboxylesterase
MTGDRMEKVTFQGAHGDLLDARLDLPEGHPRGYALVAHCFTCTKHLVGITRISRALAARGWAVLRFDFTGLGNSEGEFGNTDFSSNVEDVVAAAEHLRQHRQAPALLIGHSFGGPAVLRAAERIPEARAVCTINAPFDPEHITELLGDAPARAAKDGSAEVTLQSGTFRLSRRFFEDVAGQAMEAALQKLNRPLLVFHAPTDPTVGIENARLIYEAARHPKSFVSLDGADHLVTRPQDAVFLAGMLATWAERYVPAPAAARPQRLPEVGYVEVTETRTGTFTQRITVGKHELIADEPESFGGTDEGPSPYDLVTAGLGACTSMTLRLYANRKKWPLERVRVQLRHEKIHAKDCSDCDTVEGKLDLIERTLHLEGPLDAGQRARLMEIADRCPVHRTLESEIKVRTRLGEGS